MKSTTLVILLCTYPMAKLAFQYLTTDVAPPSRGGLRIAARPFPLNQVIRAASRKHRVNAAFVKSIIAAGRTTEK